MITAQNLKIDKTFKAGAVYLVSNGMEKAVLKAEGIDAIGTSTTGTRVDWVNRMGGTPEMKKTIMIASKIIDHVTKGDTNLGGVKTFNKAETAIIAGKVMIKQQYDESYRKKLTEQNVWFLMPLLSDFSGIGYPEFGTEENQRDPSSYWTRLSLKVKNDIKTKPKCMRSLGHVLVCDAFVANTDRFGKLAESNYERLPELANANNVFICWDKRHSNPYFLGIDFFDTQNLNEFCYFGVNWPTLEKLLHEQINNTDDIRGEKAEKILFNFQLLKKGNVKLRDEAAVWAGKALARHISRVEKAEFTFSTRHVKELREGMREGRDRLESFYKKRMYKAEWPAGLESRFKACGW